MYDFDAEYGSPDPEPVTSSPEPDDNSTAAADLVTQITSGAPPEPVDDSYLTDVDRRLEVAQYYRELLRSSLFSEDGTSATIVEREVRAFVRSRLEVLLSIRRDKEPPPPSQFSETEVQALKIIIRELMKRPDVFSSTKERKPVAPSIRQTVVVAEPPVVQKAVAPLPRVTPPTPPRSPVEAPKVVSKPPEPTPEKKRPGRKPGPQTSLKKTVVDRAGEEHEIEVQRIQRPTGAVPFPSNMEAATAVSAMNAVAASNRNPLIGTITTLARNAAKGD